MDGRDGHGSPRVTREVLRAGRRALLSTTIAFALGLLAASVALGVFASGAFAWGSAEGPPASSTTPPFLQCRAIGRDRTCGYLIDVTTKNGSLATSVIQDPRVGFFDGEDDVTVGVQNDTAGLLTEVHVGFAKSGEKLFGFDGDGLCSEKIHPKPEECPFGPGLKDPVDYLGPDTSFEKLEGTEGGTVSFPAPLGPGQYTYFSLEAGSSKTIVAGHVDDIVSTLLTNAKTGESGTALESSVVVPITDQATIQGPFAAEATGTVEYLVYGTPSCAGLPVEELGKKPVSGGRAETSNASGALEPNHTYYWVARYSGDGNKNQPTESTCGSETMTFGSPPVRAHTKITTQLSGGGQRGTQITVTEGAPVTDTATVTPLSSQPVSGIVYYAAYGSPTCTSQEVSGLGEGGETTGVGPSSNAVTLPAGKYYFQAIYSGSPTLAEAIGECGTEVLTVLPKQVLRGAPPGGAFSSSSAPSPLAPSSAFALDGVRVNATNGEIALTAQFPAAGTATAFAIVSHGATLARVSRAGSAAHKRCKRGFVAVRKHCVSDAHVQYGAASLAVSAPGLYAIVVKPVRRALQALRRGRSLYVGVSVTFQNRLGGEPVTQTRTVLVKLARGATKHKRR